MTEIPQPTASIADLVEWQEIVKKMKKLKVQEHFLRLKCFNGFFPAPKEGTNNYDLPEHYVLKGKHNINRNIDPAALATLAPGLREAGIAVEVMVKYTPELVKAEYNKLTAEEQVLFDQVLTVKPGSPGLEIVLPKKWQPKPDAAE